MNIGYLTASISRIAGGVSGSIRSLASSMCALDVRLCVFAGADNFSEADSSEWTVPLKIFPVRGPDVFGYQVGLRKALQSSQCDIVHIHGLWMYPSVATCVLRKKSVPYVISPHGMLDPWAVVNSAWKKRLAALFYEKRHLRGAACIHALCEAEYAAIRAYGLENPVAIIPNGVALPGTHLLPRPRWESSLSEQNKVLLFLSRIHPKKGLVNLLRAWALMQSERMNAQPGWFLIIAGWDQDGHLAELERLATELRIDRSVRFTGPQFGQEKAASFSRADAFILPSFSEGLPMAVLEAWSYGLPVLMSSQCNLPQGFAHGAALQIEPTVAGVAVGLRKLVQLEDGQLKEIGANGLNLVKRDFSLEKVASSMLSVYRWILGQGKPPSCVRFD